MRAWRAERRELISLVVSDVSEKLYSFAYTIKQCFSRFMCLLQHERENQMADWSVEYLGTVGRLVSDVS